MLERLNAIIEFVELFTGVPGGGVETVLEGDVYDVRDSSEIWWFSLAVYSTVLETV